MNTLIVYATKHGTTGKCASILSKKLTGKVELCNLKEGAVPNLEKYDKVVVGGSIYAGRIQKEVSEFCSKNLNLLKNKKIGLFICCMFKENAETQLNAVFPQELQSAAAVKAGLGGGMIFSDMNFGEKLIVKMVSKVMAKKDTGSPAIDTKKDVLMTWDENIDKFAQSMNNA